MKYYISVLCLVASIGIASCGSEKNKETSSSQEIESIANPKNTPLETAPMDKADSLVAATIAAHGGKRYDTAHYGFRFRDKKYTFHNTNSGFTYTVTGHKEGKTIKDILQNGTLTRMVDGDTVQLSPKDVAKYTEALNSVVYFATLPHKLKDPAVNASYEGLTTIKGKDYQILAISFDQKDGGVDHEDHFMYWVHPQTKIIDYMAYDYETNDGGVRFRSAYDPQTVGGIRFQDYVNYEAPVGTPLKELPALYEAGKLKELSRIETEEVTVLEE
ncbi:DUF6503 family protein [Pricia sp. S334]|uniref:DUF6503 family protein n=1 Tax=Pricia mediterranea TaxID=3076079 RepID=A0ABU3L3Z2_9FLAO|nr:DUF6503 family protein [Pricia sp. S334]MDT7828461.1 DUF6503 family protein [Pricia sp. S334]